MGIDLTLHKETRRGLLRYAAVVYAGPGQSVAAAGPARFQNTIYPQQQTTHEISLRPSFLPTRERKKRKKKKHLQGSCAIFMVI